MDAEHVGARAIHHMEEETLQYLGVVFVWIVGAHGHLRLKAGVLCVCGLKQRDSRAHSDFDNCPHGHLPFWLHIHSVPSEIQQEKQAKMM